ANLGKIILTQMDSHLHTPICFIIKHLAFIDLGNFTVICPKMLLAFFPIVIIRAFFSLFIYLAICSPLLYNVIISQRICHVLVGIPYIYSAFQALMFTIKIFTLTLFVSNVISHFYCDDVPLVLILCSNAQEIELTILFIYLFTSLLIFWLFAISLGPFNLISSLLVILVSYLLILIVIFQMHSTQGRKRAFSTCGSHLSVAVAFYGSLPFMYIQPKFTHSFDTDKMASSQCKLCM
uniref:G-protein coupled receptors family 1 profile domain-containing protein n=1 Tax=Sus scrofa TaxID=9823 RepID=A0A4X1T0Z4_PIG